MSDPRLYIFVNERLPSMNVGKAFAHAAHAANLFSTKMERLKKKELIELDDEGPQSHSKLIHNYNIWLEQGDGFGTTITLDVNSAGDPFSPNSKMNDVINELAKSYEFHGVSAGFVVDTSYPFSAPFELINLMSDVDYDMSVIYEPYSVVHATREEVTAAYIFIDKDSNDPVVKIALKELSKYNLR